MGYWNSVPQALLLPVGSNVNLQHLSIFSHDNRTHHYRLENLQAATQLTYIDFCVSYPMDLYESGWPAYMPKLQVIQSINVPAVPPEQLIGYRSLRHLELGGNLMKPDHDQVVLPTWFSQLTQLESLRLRCDLSAFPLYLLHLKQLQSLNLRQCGLTYVQLPSAVFEFLDFPALTRLDLSGSSHYNGTMIVPSHTERLLARLQQLLRPGVLQYRN